MVKAKHRHPAKRRPYKRGAQKTSLHSMSGGLVQHTMKRIPSQHDLAQTAMVATTCARMANRVAGDYGSLPAGCAFLLRNRIGGALVQGEFHNGGPTPVKHTWVEKDGMVFDSAFDASASDLHAGSASFLVIPKDSPYAREHYRIVQPEAEHPHGDELAKYLLPATEPPVVPAPVITATGTPASSLSL